MVSFIQLFDSIQEVVAAVFQEIFALALFGAAFLFFKYVQTSRVPPKPQKQAKTIGYSRKSAETPPARTDAVSEGKCNYKIDQKRIEEAEVQIMALLERREFTAALNAYRVFEREGLDRAFVNEAMYSGFIESAVRVGKLDVVDRMLRVMIRNGITPSLNFWHSTLKMLSSRKHFSACLQVYSTYGHLLPGDKVIFSCLINAALEGGMPESAISMLNRYQQCDLEIADYVTAFRAYVAMGNAQLAEKLFMHLGAKTTPLMLNLLLLVCINAKQPNRAMSNVLKAHEFEHAAADSARIVDTISYNTVIKGFVANCDMPSCFQCLKSMHSHNLETDDVTLTSLLEISLHDETGAKTDGLIQMLKESGQEKPLDAATCNLFIKGLIRADRAQNAFQVYETLKKSGGFATIVTYSMLIKSLVDDQAMESALLMVEEMVSTGVAPDEIIFTHLLEGCRLVGNHALGEKLFDDMLASGVRPSEYTLTMMLKLHGRYGAHEKSQQLVENWEAQHGMKPSVIHYTCLMSGCLRSKAYDQCWASFQLMEKNGVSPDEVMMTTLLPAMVVSKKYDRVVHLTKRALKRPGGIRVANATLNTALSQMWADRTAAKEAQEMNDLMQAAGIMVTSRVAPRKVDQAAPWRARA